MQMKLHLNDWIEMLFRPALERGGKQSADWLSALRDRSMSFTGAEALDL